MSNKKMAAQSRGSYRRVIRWGGGGVEGGQVCGPQDTTSVKFHDFVEQCLCSLWTNHLGTW